MCSFQSVALYCMSRALDDQEECFRYSLCPELELNALGVMFVERMLTARNIIRTHPLIQDCYRCQWGWDGSPALSLNHILLRSRQEQGFIRQSLVNYFWLFPTYFYIPCLPHVSKEISFFKTQIKLFPFVKPSLVPQSPLSSLLAFLCSSYGTFFILIIVIIYELDF